MTTPAVLRHRGLALLYALVCHGAFALGAGGMVLAMYFGLSRSFGEVPWPWAALTNALLIAQFPLGHSFFLTGPGRRWLVRLAPAPFGETLSVTTYAAIASLQLLLLFALWTPSGIVWWQAEGVALALWTLAYAAAWGFLALAGLYTGWQVQSGVLGWLALFRGRKPKFPDMPERGPYRYVRHPIYLGFICVLWTVPVWTPDQLSLALAFSAYCILAPRRKERRLLGLHGARYADYMARVGYLPRLPRPRKADHA
ncbi:MAG: isoprenylcysteine carboxylmethyltransferase family protein [Rhodobacteraceae bacterium]|nr:isoprenylcysteine carboxylmethyltransferase family protein [Paracoccaceae bacterium]